MFSPSTVVIVIAGYVALLFALAQAGERSGWGRRVAAHPLTFALGLTVYCTTWTFFGSVGRSATGGMLFLPVYLGPTLAMVVGWRLFRRMAELKHQHRLTSVADFVSARYGRSQTVAALVTVMLSVGLVPYLALQVKSLVSSFTMLTGTESAWFAPLLVAAMVALTIAFGLRHLDPTERHPGMVVVVAFESVVKLLAFLAAGVFVVGLAFPDTASWFSRLDELGAKLPTLGPSGANDVLSFVTVTVLAAGAFAFLPRQFHQGLIENSDPAHVKTAMWATPLYLFLMNVFVVPIALAGKVLALPGTSPDTYVLALPLQAGQAALSMFIYVGSLSAALGMVIVETMAMTTMISNHLVLPLATRLRPLGVLKPRMLQVRWAAAALLMVAAWQFAVQFGGAQMLVSIGLVSFAAAFLLVVPLVGGLVWKEASRVGALAGLGGGFAAWVWTLLVPTFVKSGWLPKALLDEGPLGFTALRPEALFGVEGLPPLVHGALFSVAAVVVGYVGGSVLAPPSRDEALLTEAFLGQASDQLAHLDGQQATIEVAETTQKAVTVFTEYMPADKARALVDEVVGGLTPVDGKLTVVQYAELLQGLERVLAGAIGSASAHVAMKAVGSVERKDKKTLEREFARVLAELKLNPRELKQRVDFEQEKAALLEEQFRALEAKNGELEGRVRERTRELRAILDNVLFGFLVVGRDGVVREGHTRSCQELLAADRVAGEPLGGLLRLSTDEALTFAQGIDQVFDDFLPDDVATAQLPQRFKVGDRSLRVEARAVRDDAGAIGALLFTVTDVTRLEAVELENEGNRALLNILKQKPAFEAFLDETRAQLASAADAASRSDAQTVRRVVHTIKGNAASYGLSPVVRLAHRLEEHEHLEPDHLEELSLAFREFLETHEPVLGVRFDAGRRRTVQLSVDDLRALERLAPHLPGDERGALSRWLEQVSQVPTRQLLGPIEATVSSLATRLGKEVALELKGLEARVDPERLRPFCQSLVHVLRNAVDHGLERPSERGAKGPTGHLTIELVRGDEADVVHVVDDGQGIDVERLVAVALARGVVQPAEVARWSDSEKVQLVFRDQVSTADEVTDLSGRGVGMAAVKAEVERLGGSIDIETTRGKGTRFSFTLPKPQPVVLARAA
ncbi:MAG: ATP-binding protein [Myxococcaceae bacterium]|jgi:Na+/proline symporter/HPt (histidine-containing phosphotransfer) domain-containing protein|nr:ATP-binding protein [Myxococcaceae bacterium]